MAEHCFVQHWSRALPPLGQRAARRAAHAAADSTGLAAAAAPVLRSSLAAVRLGERLSPASGEPVAAALPAAGACWEQNPPQAAQTRSRRRNRR